MEKKLSAEDLSNNFVECLNDGVCSWGVRADIDGLDTCVIEWKLKIMTVKFRTMVMYDAFGVGSNRSLLPSGGLMADVPCLDHSLDGCKGYPDDVQTTKHARRTHAWSRCTQTSLGAHVSPFGALSARLAPRAPVFES